MTSPPLDPAYALARRLGFPEPDDGLLDVITDALADAEADVEGYLGRPIHPVTRSVDGCWPVAGGWDIPGETGRIRSIVSAVPQLIDGTESGMFTVTYLVGIDYLADAECRPIRRYVTAAAANDYLLLNYLEGQEHRRGPVTSVSVSTEGQSKTVQYGHLGYTPPASRGTGMTDYPGALPAKSTMDRWRIANRRVVQAGDPGYDARLYNYSGLGVPYRDRDGFWNQP